MWGVIKQTDMFDRADINKNESWENRAMDRDRIEPAYRLTKKQFNYLVFKRAMDMILSAGAIAVLSPVFILIVLAIKLDSPGPVLFKQKRIGKNKKVFDIFKFRTMRIDAPKDMPTHLLTDSERYITKVGRFLRKTSLDELPQFFNIIRGEMYIISYRPGLWNQKDLMEERDKYGVHVIAPGLTGWAQIHGRDKLEIKIKARLDGEYIEKLGLAMDIRCFLGSIGCVLSHDGILEGGTKEERRRKEEQKST